MIVAKQGDEELHDDDECARPGKRPGVDVLVMSAGCWLGLQNARRYRIATLINCAESTLVRAWHRSCTYSTRM